jgi:predicted HTH domain antitoxin
MKKTKPKALPSKQEAVLQRYKKRRITLRQGAELLGISYLEMDELLRESGIPLADDPNLLRGWSPGKRR